MRIDTTGKTLEDCFIPLGKIKAITYVIDEDHIYNGSDSMDLERSVVVGVYNTLMDSVDELQQIIKKELDALIAYQKKVAQLNKKIAELEGGVI